MVEKIVIASKNPVKINAVKIAFERMFPQNEYEVIGVSVISGVSDQPMTDEETFKGAQNRVENARVEISDADYFVGIEGGIEVINNEMQVFAWIYIKSLDGREGKGKTSCFYLPKKIAKLVKEGYELGDANDIVFNGHNLKQKNGSIGTLTGDLITRTSYYVEAVTVALIPFNNTELYFEEMEILN